MMNDVLAAKWKRLSADIKKEWVKLTDEDLSRISGKKERLLSMLEEKYGYARTRAQQELDAFLSKGEPPKA